MIACGAHALPTCPDILSTCPQWHSVAHLLKLIIINGGYRASIDRNAICVTDTLALELFKGMHNHGMQVFLQQMD